MKGMSGKGTTTTTKSRLLPEEKNFFLSVVLVDRRKGLSGIFALQLRFSPLCTGAKESGLGWRETTPDGAGRRVPSSPFCVGSENREKGRNSQFYALMMVGGFLRVFFVREGR